MVLGIEPKVMRPITFVLATLCLVPAGRAADYPAPVKTAIEKGLRRIGQGSTNYLKNRDCFSCHHQAVPILAMATARKQGFVIDPAQFRQQVDFTLNSFKKHKPISKGNMVAGGNTMAAYALFALEAAGHAPDATSDALVDYLLVRQKPDGSWPALMKRPPSEGSSFTNAALALRALQAYGKGRGDASRQQRIDKAFKQGREWLLGHELADTEDRAFHLRALVQIGANKERIDKAKKQLLSEQRNDGSWAQLPDRPGDAYATGTVLTALRASGLPASDPACQKAVKYLLNTQREDGAWLVESRSRPVQTYFDNGDPGGKSQFISMSATAWAVQALLEAGK